MNIITKENAKNVAIICTKPLAALAAATYLYDCYHVWSVWRREQHYVDSVEPTKVELAKLYHAYALDKAIDAEQEQKSDNDHIHHEDPDHLMVDIEEFKDTMEKTLEEREQLIHDKNTDFSKLFQINREIVLFLGAGRAVLLQTAHPYVAAGIAQHSKLITAGPAQRFFGTFRYVFRVLFGTPESFVSAANTVRTLHAKVYGELKEEVGAWPKGHRYSASNLHALYWVHVTLVDAGIFMYELFVKSLTVPEKERLIKDSSLQAGAFGIPKEIIPKTWEDFQRQKAVFIQSDLLTPSNDAQMIKTFLLAPPKKLPSHVRIVINFVHWFARITLPDKTSLEYFGKKIGNIEFFLWVLIGGFIKFVMRLAPTTLRYSTQYLNMIERLQGEFDPITKTVKTIAYHFSKGTIKELLGKY